MANARDQFKIGDSVQASAEGRRALSMTSMTGVVVGFGRTPELVRVKRDGLKTPYTFHERFWEKVG